MALALAAVCAFSTTITPSDYHDVPRLAVASDCSRLCAFASHPAGLPTRENETVVAAPRIADAGDATETSPEAATDTLAEAANPPMLEASGEPVDKTPLEPPITEFKPTAAITIAQEPITSRPVADRFDFAGAAIVTTLAQFNQDPAGQQFAALPTTELKSLPASQQTVSLSPVRELTALPPLVQLTATLDQPALRASKVPQVAGWSLIRTIETEELSEEASLTTVAMPLLPVKKPDVPKSYLTAPPRQIPQAKISRRVRQRAAPTPAANKTAAPEPKTTSDRSWKNNALFRDY